MNINKFNGGYKMLRLMNSGISGMQANQTALDVIGNNIANQETVAFKGSRARFQDMLSQSQADGTSPTVSAGGTNPSQIGLGVKLAGIDTITTQGIMQPTNSNLDVAIDGDGYFLVSKGNTIFNNGTVTGGITANNAANGDHTINQATLTASGSQISYTRDGAFTLDEQGNLLTSDGYRVMGYSMTNAAGADSIATSGDINYVDGTATLTANDTSLKTLRIPATVTDTTTTPTNTFRVTSFSIGRDGVIIGTLEDGRTTAIGQIAMASFKNPAGLSKQGKNLYSSSVNSGDATLRSGAGNTANDNSGGYGDALQNMLEMSNVDLAQQFTDMIVASRAFQANGKAITTGDDILQDIINLKR
jgi:flagellar hook protein FlgE